MRAGCPFKLCEKRFTLLFFSSSLGTPPNSQLAGSASLEGKGQLKFTSGRWSPHHTCTQVATANDTTIRGWDTRSMRSVAVVTRGCALGPAPSPHPSSSTRGRLCVPSIWVTQRVCLCACVCARVPLCVCALLVLRGAVALALSLCPAWSWKTHHSGRGSSAVTVPCGCPLTGGSLH